MKQFLTSVLLVLLLSMALGFAIHGVLLKNDYAGIPTLMRGPEDAQRHFPVMIAAHLLAAIGLTAIYRYGREAGRPWFGQGVRFGIWFAVASCIPGFLIYYAVEPMPRILVEKQIGLETAATILIGIALARVNKQPPLV